jgi:hypothetical protein
MGSGSNTKVLLVEDGFHKDTKYIFWRFTMMFGPLCRLVGETKSSSVSSVTSVSSYNYDLAGNRTSVVINSTTNNYQLG